MSWLDDIFDALSDIADWTYKVMEASSMWMIKNVNINTWFTVFTIGTVIEMNAVIASIGAAVNESIAASIHNIKSFVATMAHTVHFETLVQCHQILMFVDADYRKTMNKFYGGLGKFSEYIGQSASFMRLMLKSSEVLTVDAYTTMGLSYDEAKLKYVDQSANFFGVLEDRANRYWWNPYLLDIDLMNFIEREAGNNKAKYQSAMGLLLSETVSSVDKTIQDVVTLRRDLDEFAQTLPPAWSRQMLSMINSGMKKFDSFIVDHYNPEMKRLWAVLDIFKIEKDTNTKNIFQLAKTVDNPFKMLIDAWVKPIKEIIGVEDKITQIVMTPLSTEAAIISEIAQPTEDELIKLSKKEILLPAPIKLLTLEPELPTPLGIYPAKIRVTWFVGDY